MFLLLVIPVLIVIWFVYIVRLSYCNMKLLDYAAMGEIYCVRDFLRTRADINAHDPNGKTPLILASQIWSTQVSQVLPTRLFIFTQLRFRFRLRLPKKTRFHRLRLQFHSQDF